MTEANGWRRCSNCKQEIGFGQVYWVCSVTTCNRKRTGLVFCNTSCWDAHLPLMRHREAWAVEERAPSRAAHQQEQRNAAASQAPAPARPAAAAPPPHVPRRIVSSGPAPAPTSPDQVSKDILVVTSKLKKYVRARWGMNTSDAVMELLSDRLRALCEGAVRNARRDERKTLMKRDF